MGMLLGGHVNKYKAIGPDVVTLSGEVSQAFNFGADARAEIKIDNDGLAYKRSNGGTWNQIDGSADWIRPTNSAGSPYRCRYTNLVGDALDGATSQAEDTWMSTVNDFFFVAIDTSPTLGGKDSDFDIEVDDGTTLQDSGAYTLQADREDF